MILSWMAVAEFSLWSPYAVLNISATKLCLFLRRLTIVSACCGSYCKTLPEQKASRCCHSTIGSCNSLYAGATMAVTTTVATTTMATTMTGTATIYGNNGNNYGRKLKQGGVVANIICDTLGNCNDNGRRYYDGGRDDRWATLSDHSHSEHGFVEGILQSQIWPRATAFLKVQDGVVVSECLLQSQEEGRRRYCRNYLSGLYA